MQLHVVEQFKRVSGVRSKQSCSAAVVVSWLLERPLNKLTQTLALSVVTSCRWNWQLTTHQQLTVFQTEFQEQLLGLLLGSGLKIQCTTSISCGQCEILST